ITVVLDVDFGTTFFGQPYPNPGILGATGTASNMGTFSDLRQRLINGASNAGESQLYNALPATAVPIELNNSVTSFSNAEVTRANARALGIVPDITNPESLSLGEADAGIGFNSAFPFDFNPDDGITSGLTDFDSVATHEIGHALGFVSDAGSDESLVTVWDLFRFRPGLASLETFATAPRVMSTGGSQVFFSNEVTTYGTFELGLSTGGPDGNAGDGHQSSHWRDDRLDPPRQYIGIMDPTLVDGARKTLSENDMKAIDLFGYSIGGPPIVRPPNDNFANAILLSTASGSVNAGNVNATREFGEPLHAGLLGDKSIWYTWQSSVNGQATFDTIGSNFDTTLAVYTGSALFQLSTVAQNDDIQNGVNRVSRVQFNITAGTTYRIAVDGWNSEFGNVTLNWTSSGVVPTPTPTPTPSDFALESFVATPNPVGITQYVNFKVSARALNGPALNPTISVVLPFGVTFVGCEPFCVAPGTSDGGTVNANFGDLSPDTLVILVVTARVTAPIGSILPSTATLITSNPDAVPGNNSALTTFTVRDVIPFLEVKKLSVSAIGRHVLALRGGTVWSWGTNFDGELGDGTNINRSFPAQIDDLMFVKDVGAGSGYSVALKNDGTVWTWGLDGLGQLGNGTTNGFSRNRPSQVIGLSGVTAIAAGTFHVLALKSDGTVWAWGSNGRGELGIGLQDFIAHPTPVQIPGLSNILSIYAEDGLSYAFKSNGEVWGWGSGFGGKMGDGTTGSIKPSPTELPLLKDTPTLVSALNATFAIKQDGAVWSFGYNAAGRLGRGILDTAIYPVPTQIPDVLARAVSAGETHTIVVEPGGTIKVFGGNESGQLGLGSADLSAHPSPVSLPGVSGVFATAAGGGASFVLVGDSATGGTIQAWGANVFGVLGLGTTFPISTPTVVEENLTVARPIFSIPPGTVSATQIHIACGTPGAVIHYTTNGSDPTESDPVIASGSPVTVDHSL
ncbi:MAG TPA: NF038122 family metalloprotease, partial [Pyrinomonadaceae bacterium]|nr:NF038122 family metalloprotease [Pyrinomonadaceae bacterium]